MLAAISHAALVFSPLSGRGFFSLEGQVITVIPGFLFLWLLTVGVALLRQPELPA